VIQPTIQFTSRVEFTTNRLGEHGHPVQQDFEFQSGKNQRFLTIHEIVAMNEIAGV
jgi:UDP-N-acetylglucosamine 4,6-dehydratase